MPVLEKYRLFRPSLNTRNGRQCVNRRSVTSSIRLANTLISSNYQAAASKKPLLLREKVADSMLHRPVSTSILLQFVLFLFVVFQGKLE